MLEARQLGLDLAERCEDKARRVAGFDAEGARRFIVSWVRRHGPTSGEDLVQIAQDHGYRGHDARCFGGLFRAAVNRGELLVIRSDLPRRNGHGCSVGRLYGVGA